MTPPWTGGRTSERATCVLAPNPGVMTLEGTNTWVLREPGAPEAVVVDPGPDDDAHLAAVLETAGADGGRVAQILLTHHHRDHTDGVPALAAATGAPVRGAGEGRPFGDGERLEIGGLVLQVLATPGHTADSVSVMVPEDRLLLTGDTVIGRGTTAIGINGDGDLGDYLRTLDQLSTLADLGSFDRIGPGHGPVIDDPQPVLADLKAHRWKRLEEVRAAVDAGAHGVDEVARAVYGSLAADRRWAVEHSVRAQLHYLNIRHDLTD
ncbi:MBL fold metallo-hydrolase [Georgenia alba]|uniref:MBL fold metallo-hydrolase n=1 Tax=Georgenia alba TaxID=2233858 RepID=A0ABW2Q8R3_9MICO